MPGIGPHIPAHCHSILIFYLFENSGFIASTFEVVIALRDSVTEMTMDVMRKLFTDLTIDPDAIIYTDMTTNSDLTTGLIMTNRAMAIRLWDAGQDRTYHARAS